MSSLQRYRRVGGFLQLVSLIETFGPQKKDKFLEMIEAESKGWATALREKMLTVDRIMEWPGEAIREVFGRLPPKNMAFAISGLRPEQSDKLMAFLSVSDKRRLNDVMSENSPKPEEVAATHTQVLEIARKMLTAMELRADKLDVKLIIPENIELSLDTFKSSAQPEPKAKPAPAPKMTMAQLQAENAALKAEIENLTRQLAQVGIKKAA